MHVFNFAYLEMFNKAPEDRIAFASKVKTLAQTAHYEIKMLELNSLTNLAHDLDVIMHGMTLAMKFTLEPEDTMMFQRRAIMNLQLSDIVQEEAKRLFCESDGWKKFIVYKSLDVLSDTLFLLASALTWGDADGYGVAIQHALGNLGDFVVTVSDGNPWKPVVKPES